MSEKVLMKGNEAIGEAAIRSGCRHFFGYPITPQTELSAYMAKKMPKTAMISQQQTQRKRLLPAMRLASLLSRLPSARESSVATPTPVPVPRPMSMFCAGNASDSAERQSSDTLATYMLSTML